MSNDLTQGASIEAERAACVEIIKELGWTVNGTFVVTKSGDEIHTLDALAFLRAARRTPAAAAGAGELPPLPKPMVSTRHGTPCYTVGQMMDHARAAITADRAQRHAAHTAEMEQWARDNGLNVPPQWNGTVTDYGTPAAPASAQPTDGTPQRELLTEIQQALDSLADTKMTTHTYVSMANALHHCRDALLGRGYFGAQPDQRESAAEAKTGSKHSKLPWRLTDAPRKIVSADGSTVANLTALDLPNAELIVSSVNTFGSDSRIVYGEAAVAILKAEIKRLSVAPSPAAQPVAKDDGSAA